jgi:hypothetical protein
MSGLIRHGERQAMTFEQEKEYAGMLAQSGVFKDCGNAARALVKMKVAESLGLHAMDGMRGIHIFDGKIELGATLIASLIKKSNKYNYHILQHDENGCAILFTRYVKAYPENSLQPTSMFGPKTVGEEPVSYRDPADKWGTKTSVSVWTKDDTKKAGLEKKDNHAKYPKAMNYARALAQGARWFCPDVFGGDCYAEGELSNALPTDVPPAVIESKPSVVVGVDPGVDPPAVVIQEEPVVDIPFEPVSAPTSPPPATKDALVERVKKLFAELNMPADVAKRIITRHGVAKLADMAEGDLEALAMKLQAKADISPAAAALAG